MPEKSFSFGTFMLGFILGVVVALALIVFGGFLLVQQVVSGNMRISEDFFEDTSLRDSVVRMFTEQGNIFLYGKFVGIEGNTITLEREDESGSEMVTFRYDAATQFAVSGYEDGAVIETPFSPAALTVGEYVTVYTEEPVGTVEDQYAVKVLRQ